MGEKNYWKIASIVLLFACVIILVNDYRTQSQEVVDLQAFQADRADLQKFIDVADGRGITLCSLKENKCVRILAQ